VRSRVLSRQPELGPFGIRCERRLLLRLLSPLSARHSAGEPLSSTPGIRDGYRPYRPLQRDVDLTKAPTIGSPCATAVVYIGFQFRSGADSGNGFPGAFADHGRLFGPVAAPKTTSLQTAAGKAGCRAACPATPVCLTCRPRCTPLDAGACAWRSLLPAAVAPCVGAVSQRCGMTVAESPGTLCGSTAPARCAGAPAKGSGSA